MDKIKALQLDLPDYQKRTIRSTNCFVRRSGRDYFGEKELSERGIDCSTYATTIEPKKAPKKKTFQELKVLMLRYELKERRAKTEDKKLLEKL